MTDKERIFKIKNELLKIKKLIGKRNQEEITDDFGQLFCSVDKTSWYRYNVEPKYRPYYNRVDNLRKFKLPN